MESERNQFMDDVFYGMHWMLATPFLENEQVDYDSIPNIVKKAKEVDCKRYKCSK